MVTFNMRKLYIIMPTINMRSYVDGAYLSIINSEFPDDVKFRFCLLDQDSVDVDVKSWQEDHPETDYIRFSPRVALSAAWNEGVKKALEWGATHIGIFNDDVILHPKTLKHLMAFMDHTKYLLVTADNIKDRMSIETMMHMELPNEFTDHDCDPINDWRAEGPDFSCYMIRPETVAVIGKFDENFRGAYCEDQDYHIRINRALHWAKIYGDQKVPAEQIHAKRLSTAPYYHFASQTLARNAHIRDVISVQHGRNMHYYIQKWGAGHNEAMDGAGFIQPFGDATKNWRDW